nr:hypothetical protein CFP56_27012 [Quercus suber]
MAASPINHHFRSNSFPTRAHPLISEFDEQLSRLRCSEATSSSSTSLSQKLIGLQDLHDCVDNLLFLPFSQALAQEQNQKWLNELLDGSLRLLDVCGIARDALLQTKECTRELQSTLRRRHGSKMELAREVEKYLASRKVAKKAIKKDWMGKLESSIQDVEEVLECFSRRLVKTRVSFLNILNR